MLMTCNLFDARAETFLAEVQVENDHGVYPQKVCVLETATNTLRRFEKRNNGQPDDYLESFSFARIDAHVVMSDRADVTVDLLGAISPELVDLIKQHGD